MDKQKLLRRQAMRKNLQGNLRYWLKHWYLGGGRSYNRALLTPDAKNLEQIAYKLIYELLGNDTVISPNASPLSLPKSIGVVKKIGRHQADQ